MMMMKGRESKSAMCKVLVVDRNKDGDGGGPIIYSPDDAADRSASNPTGSGVYDTAAICKCRAMCMEQPCESETPVANPA